MIIEHNDIQSEGSYGFFSVRVAAICLFKNKILLHKKKTDSFWNTIGGKIKLGESSKEALKREFQEELGVDIQILNIASVVENFFEFEEKPYHEIIFLYNIKIIHDTISPEENSELIFKLFSIDSIKTLDIRPIVTKDIIIDNYGINKFKHNINKEY